MPESFIDSMRLRCGSAAHHILGVIAIAALACKAMAAAQIDQEQLLEMAIDRVKTNTHALSRLTCEEHTSRWFYVGSSKGANAQRQTASQKTTSDAFLPALLTSIFQGRDLLWSDRLRVELSLFDGKDMFSWPGGNTFDSDIDNLISNGATLSGILGPFDVSVLLNDADPSSFRYQDTVTAFGKTLVRYAYKVPVQKSHLIISDLAEKRVPVPYEGFFLVDASTGDLRRLCVELNDFPQNTNLSLGAVATDYGAHTIGDTVAFVPVSSTMRLLFKQGALAVNAMQYVDCHQFQAESTLHFNGVPEASGGTQKSISERLPTIPKNRVVKLALSTAIDSHTASTGDLVQAHVVKSLKGKDGEILIPAGALVRGRILRLVQYAPPYNSVQLILKFDQIALNGSIAGVRLSPREAVPQDGAQNLYYTVNRVRRPVPISQGKTNASNSQDDRKNGTGTFEFDNTDHLHLPVGYVTEWIVN